MKTLIGFFDSMAQVRQAMELLGTASFGSPTMTAISDATRTAHPINVQKPESPGEEGLPTNSADTVSAMAGRLPLAAILDPITSDEINSSLKDEPSARPITDPGLASIPGGLAGALKRWGFSGADVRNCEQQVAQGHALLVVELTSDNDSNTVQQTLIQEGADRVLDSGHLKI